MTGLRSRDFLCDDNRSDKVRFSTRRLRSLLQDICSLEFLGLFSECSDTVSSFFIAVRTHCFRPFTPLLTNNRLQRRRKSPHTNFPRNCSIHIAHPRLRGGSAASRTPSSEPNNRNLPFRPVGFCFHP
ncbi:hypothetical protein CDAR_417181 [Caerostris darwini]|uniref:Uncharacterized protein n=1 Tax=Caerostris darwini TaxID=1538125 RepID=A0AAV4X991_9ARAC|nr:hypothetical protein CDAR_417181 [Caerostris darwini]